jgi:LSD1 subclass zinc finger protein
MYQDMPGEGANGALRIIGFLELGASVLVALWVLSEFSQTWDPTTGTAVSSPVGAILALAIVGQGVVIAALFVALAGMGDNLIAIRRNTSRPATSGNGPGEGESPRVQPRPQAAERVPVRQRVVPIPQRPTPEVGKRIEELSLDVLGDRRAIRHRLGIPAGALIHVYVTEDEAKAVIAELESMEGSAGKERDEVVRCANCHNEIEVPPGAETVRCTKCGTRSASSHD